MSARRTKKASSKPLTAKQRAEIAALADLPQDRIDTADIPEVRDWAGAGSHRRKARPPRSVPGDNAVAT